MTERPHFHFSLPCIGEGNGNPLQCSCLKNPRDGGAWWAAVYGVAQSQTWLKQLSSSSGSVIKNLLAMQEPQETRVSWVGKIPWRRAWQPTPVFLPGESPWTEEPGRLQSIGLQRVRHNRKQLSRACIHAHGSFIPSLLRNLHAVLHSGCTDLNCH